ncbi:MAG: hypothetical protein JOZ18_18740, partial [Chloroflexi bacterium]|nr:hypothetical protein [Chloroflexota bacterium]
MSGYTYSLQRPSHRFSLGAAFSLLVILSTILVACGGSTTSSSSGGAGTGNKKLTLAFLRPGPDPYYQDGQRAVVMAGQQQGITVQTYFSNNSQSQELANVQDAISKHVDGIEMYAVSLSAESADVAAANAAHIPIFLLY